MIHRSCISHVVKFTTTNFVKTALPQNHYNTTAVCTAGKEWREKRGLPRNANAYGPLTDKPDYHFVKTGRKAPPGSCKVRRIAQQQMWTEKIIKLTAQVDFAVELHKQRTKEEEARKTGILTSKLKQKGTIPSNSFGHESCGITEGLYVDGVMIYLLSLYGAITTILYF